MEITANVETTLKNCSTRGLNLNNYCALDFPTHQTPTTNPDSKNVVPSNVKGTNRYVYFAAKIK